MQKSIQSYEGPIPPPEILQAYDAIVPNAAERIIAMAEKEQQFGHAINMEALKTERREVRRGQILGAVVAVFALGTSAFLGYTGHGVAAAIVGGTTVVGLVGAFVGDRVQRSRAS